jgi:hypothetical protein
MHIVELNHYFDGTCIETKVSVTPVANIEVAQTALQNRVKNALKEFEVELEPVCSGHHMSLETNEELDETANDDYYRLYKLKGTSDKDIVATAYINAGETTIDWYLVD